MNSQRYIVKYNHLSLLLIFWYSTRPAVEGKFCLEAWTISRVSSYVCSVTGIFRNLKKEFFNDDSDY